MLYDVVPAKEITGGPWYTEQEFDHEFVEELCNFIVQFVRAQGMTDLNSINSRVRISGISKVELSLEELELVLQTLVYDGRLEEVGSLRRIALYHFRKSDIFGIDSYNVLSTGMHIVNCRMYSYTRYTNYKHLCS
jgi:hypothetical protein